MDIGVAVCPKIKSIAMANVITPTNVLIKMSARLSTLSNKPRPLIKSTLPTYNKTRPVSEGNIGISLILGFNLANCQSCQNRPLTLDKLKPAK